MTLYDELTIPKGERSAAIPREEAEYLYRFIRRHRLSRTLETGFGYGCSTAHIMAATRAPHVAIDPYESEYGGMGVRNIRALGLGENLHWINEPSQAALPELYAQGFTFDLVFLDGSHLYDDIFIDWYYADLMLEEGGFIFFHDLWMRSMQMVASFIRTNRRDFRRVGVPFPAIAAFRKVAEDRRETDYFRDFCPHGGRIGAAR